VAFDAVVTPDLLAAPILTLCKVIPVRQAPELLGASDMRISNDLRLSRLIPVGAGQCQPPGWQDQG